MQAQSFQRENKESPVHGKRGTDQEHVEEKHEPEAPGESWKGNGELAAEKNAVVYGLRQMGFCLPLQFAPSPR